MGGRRRGCAEEEAHRRGGAASRCQAMSPAIHKSRAGTPGSAREGRHHSTSWHRRCRMWSRRGRQGVERPIYVDGHLGTGRGAFQGRGGRRRIPRGQPLQLVRLKGTLSTVGNVVVADHLMRGPGPLEGSGGSVPLHALRDVVIDCRATRRSRLMGDRDRRRGCAWRCERRRSWLSLIVPSATGAAGSQ